MVDGHETVNLAHYKKRSGFESRLSNKIRNLTAFISFRKCSQVVKTSCLKDEKSVVRVHAYLYENRFRFMTFVAQRQGACLWHKWLRFQNSPNAQ